MLRRTIRRVCEAHHENAGVSGDKGFMTYQQACAIFGFQMNERIEKKEIKQRFNKLVLKFHPDHGGSNEQFQMLREAQKIMETHRHDKHEERQAKEGAPNFRRMTYDELNNTIHRQTADKKENRSFGSADLFVFLGMIGFMTLTYFIHAWRTQAHVARSRWRTTEDKLNPLPDPNSPTARQWHPWGSSQEQRDASYVVGVIQGSMKEEVLAKRQQELYGIDADPNGMPPAAISHHPLASRALSPFAQPRSVAGV